jgi:hypothetical protein
MSFHKVLFTSKVVKIIYIHPVYLEKLNRKPEGGGLVEKPRHTYNGRVKTDPKEVVCEVLIRSIRHRIETRCGPL